MSFVPLSRSQLRFIAEEFWPGGGENGDGRDLYGVAEHHEAWREETMDADLIAEALHPSDAAYKDRCMEEEVDRELETLDVDPDDSIRVNGQPLEEVVDEYDGDPRPPLDSKDGPDTLELAMAELQAEYRELQRMRWNEGDIVPDGSEFVSVSCTSEASRDLARFECDGVRKVSLSASRAEEFRPRDYRRREWPNIGPRWTCDPTTGHFRPNPRWNGRRRYDSWKRHREAQYRPRQICPRITDRAYRDAA